jgi:hypothetical protein
MIVYGDSHYTAGLDALVAQLWAQAAAVTPDLDGLRTLLVLAGQVEQAALDAGMGDPLAPALAAATRHAATAFYRAWDAAEAGCPVAPIVVRAALARLRRVLAPLTPPATPCRVTLPEGFAFYALYPEPYCAAARLWLADHAAAADRRAVVVGIRSIGTSLAALVAATLRAAGWQAHALTIRPTGHPFAREAHLDLAPIGAAAWGLVVDEGPYNHEDAASRRHLWA